MPMKVQTKITLLIVLVVATFVGGLWAFRAREKSKFRRINEQRFNECNRSFDAFLEKNGEPLKTLAEYDAYWDPLLEAIAKNDRKWFDANLNRETLEAYYANAPWLYRPDATLLYSLNNVPEASIELPIPREAFSKIFASEAFAHFFVAIPQGIMEIRGATIHGSADVGRHTPQRGFLFVGRLWNTPALHDMSLFSNNKLRLPPATERAEEVRNDEQNGAIVFSRPLNGWDGTPLAQLIVRNESPVVRELNRSSERLILSLFSF